MEGLLFLIVCIAFGLLSTPISKNSGCYRKPPRKNPKKLKPPNPR